MKNRMINQILMGSVGVQLVLAQSVWAKTIKQALVDTQREGEGIGDAFLALVLVFCGFGVAWSKTRMATLKHLPFIGLGAYLIYNATNVVSWIRSFIS